MPGTDTWTVASVHRYPVKSLQGETPGSITFAAGHVAGDREWAIVEVSNGMCLTAKRHGVLLEAFARTDGSQVVITLPSGAEVEAGDPATAAALSDWLGREVELRRPGQATPTYEIPRDLMDLESEAVTFNGPSTHFADLADAHVLTEASLRAASALEGGSEWDVRRFRPTMLVAGGGDEFVEDSWIGSTLEAGEAALQVFMPAPRCSMPPRAQPGLAKDMAISRTLRDHHGFALGVYAALVREGTVAVGDPVTVTAA